MMGFDVVREAFEAHGLERWAVELADLAQALNRERRHGDMDRWEALLTQLPEVVPGYIDLTEDTVRAHAAVTEAQRETIKRVLSQLKPWRKGPYDIHGVVIDTEWRSDWKWRRLSPHIQPLAGRRVLDVGCGNGYHAWRMAGEGAEIVVAIDPTQLFWVQFRAVRHFLGEAWPVHFLPVGIEEVPQNLAAFDTVFSMGVFYHRRSPIDHLLDLKGCLRPGGELVLETLVIEGGEGQVLLPSGRYAKMRNVWFIPSTKTLKAWLERCGFREVAIVDETPTTTAEQRATEWMVFESLADFLDPDDSSRTIEGYPAPRRAILTAQA